MNKKKQESLSGKKDPGEMYDGDPFFFCLTSNNNNKEQIRKKLYYKKKFTVIIFVVSEKNESNQTISSWSCQQILKLSSYHIIIYRIDINIFSILAVHLYNGWCLELVCLLKKGTWILIWLKNQYPTFIPKSIIWSADVNDKKWIFFTINSNCKNFDDLTLKNQL